MKIDLVIIDPQNDFCRPNGALYVTGADEDCDRLAKFISKVGHRLNDIHVTLDTHHYFDVAHPVFWLDQNGQNPNPFTLISHDDVTNGIWRASVSALQPHAEYYTKTLADNSRYMLCIWPPHCLIGTPGHNVFDSVAEALLDVEKGVAMIDYVTKGSNYQTEHYSAVQADVPDPNDPSTQLNTRFIQTLQSADLVLISGQALSHCVANTFRDVADNFGEENVKKLVLLEDTCSNVTGFETLGEDFIHDMTQRGMQVSNTQDFKV